MSENVLKKDFQKKDVTRLRNLIQGKYGERSSSGIGYTKKEEFYKEGDIWEEDGRKWTIKNGIKQNITKLDTAKQSASFPLFCPSCDKLMKHKYDKPFFIQYKRCYGCQIDFESWMEDLINESNQSYITEAGDVERWIGSSKQRLLESKEETIKYLQNLKKT